MPSPIFTINGQPITSSVAVSEGGQVVCTLVDITGVSPVAWSMDMTDETKVPGDYSFVQSGGYGQTYTGNALTPGTAATVKVTVAGGLDAGQPTDTLTASGKFYVPTRDGLEVLTADEQNDDNRVASATHGMVKPANEAIRRGVLIPDFDGVCLGGGFILVMDHEVQVQPETILFVEATVLAYDTTANDGAAYVVRSTWQNDTGATSQIGATSVIYEAEDDAAWSMAALTAGDNAQLRFTGDAANDTKVTAQFRAVEYLWG